MTMTDFHPGLILLIGALLAAVLPKRIRQGVMILAPFLAVLSVFGLQPGVSWNYAFLNGLELELLKVDSLSWIFALIFSLVSLIGNIYALHIKKRGESAAGLAYAGSALGVVFAGDWLTLIFFWELMTVSSVFLIWYGKTPQALKAGLRYILVHFFGGNLLLAGIFLKVSAGQTAVTALTGTGDAAFWLILLGVSVNAAIPPLSAWLSDAYPEGTISGSVFLSAFTTKVAVYCLIRLFPGAELLIWLGVIMTLYGVIFAIIENDIRRLLSYHIISQVGYMVAAAGIGTDMALNGGVAHAYSHILYKSLLFMSAGAVIYATGRRKLTELGGLFRAMPAVVILYMIAAFSISGMPLFNGFISKSMIVSAAAEGNLPIAELLLYLAGVGTFLSVGLKLPYFMFFGPDKGIKVQKIPFNMLIAMSFGAFLCILYGLMPSLLYRYLPYITVYNPFDLDHVVSTLQLLIAALAAFWIFIPKLGGHPVISLDTDWFYRKPLVAFVMFFAGAATLIQRKSGLVGIRLLSGAIPIFANPHHLWFSKERNEPLWPVYSEDMYHFPVGAAVLMILLMFIVVFACVWV